MCGNPFLPLGNNRNILECKCDSTSAKHVSLDSEIIETYWNVNYCCQRQENCRDRK